MMKTNCPFCNSKKVKDSGMWDYFECGTDVDLDDQPRQSMKCLQKQRDYLLIKTNKLQDEIDFLKIKNGI